MFEGKAVLVTGANRGLGHELLRELTSLNPAVVFAGVRSMDSAWDSDIHKHPAVRKVQIDLNTGNSFADTLSSIESLDLVVSNAAVCESTDLLNTDLQQIRSEWETNFFGPLQLIRYLSPILNQDANVVLIGSKFIHNSLPVIGNYCATKSALWLAAQAIQAMAGTAYSVQYICPGSLDTSMGKRFHGDKNNVQETAQSIVANIGNGEMLVPVTDDAVKMLDPLAREFTRNWDRLKKRSADILLR